VGHRHREQEEVYVLVAGSGRAELDDEFIEIEAWDALRVAPCVIRSFEAGRTVGWLPISRSAIERRLAPRSRGAALADVCR
jgi:hypothetical protein